MKEYESRIHNIFAVPSSMLELENGFEKYTEQMPALYKKFDDFRDALGFAFLRAIKPMTKLLSLIAKRNNSKGIIRFWYDLRIEFEDLLLKFFQNAARDFKDIFTTSSKRG